MIFIAIFSDSAFQKPTKTKWSFRAEPIQTEQTEQTAKQYGIPRIIASVLLNRGIDDISVFLSKSKKNIRHPAALPDAEKAANRIILAAKRKEKVIVYGDYDVDGMTSTAIMTDFLRSIGIDAEYYIPDRVSEGYGLNSGAIEKFAKDGVQLVVTVDCGITNLEEAETAFRNNVDLVITDHHTCLDTLPHAYAIVNPKRADSEYGFTGLAGVGVAFKLCLAIGLKLGIKSGEIFDKYCTLAAIGTIADVVPLTDENRIIVAKGLEMLSSREFIGIDAILRMLEVDKSTLVSTNVSFNIAPKLNAAGRLGDPTSAVRLLMTNDRAEAERIASELDVLNSKRRELEKEVYDQIVKYLDAHYFELCERIIVVKGQDWNHGVIGRVAAMIAEKYSRPCVIVSFTGKHGKGSCRSVEGFDMFEALCACSEFLDDFGGHKAAAGLSLTRRKWGSFRRAICRHARDKITPEQAFIKSVTVDCEIFPHEITLENAKMMSLLEPFGAENPRPVFVAKDLIIENISLVGADKKHVRIQFSHNNMRFNAIGFNLAVLYDHFRERSRVDCVFTLEVNSYNGVESVQMKLSDMDWSESLRIR